MILPRLRAQDALEVEGTISGDRGSAALRQVQTGTACTNRRGSAVFVMPALLAGLFGYSVSIVSYHPRVDRIGEESDGSGGNSVRALRWLKGLNVRGSLSMHVRFAGILGMNANRRIIQKFPHWRGVRLATKVQRKLFGSGNAGLGLFG
jgi:hypothetical protein